MSRGTCINCWAYFVPNYSIHTHLRWVYLVGMSTCSKHLECIFLILFVPRSLCVIKGESFVEMRDTTRRVREIAFVREKEISNSSKVGLNFEKRV